MLVPLSIRKLDTRSFKNLRLASSTHFSPHLSYAVSLKVTKHIRSSGLRILRRELIVFLTISILGPAIELLTSITQIISALRVFALSVWSETIDGKLIWFFCFTRDCLDLTSILIEGSIYYGLTALNTNGSSALY